MMQLETCAKLVIFDLDGTLNETHLFSIPAFQSTLKEMGVTGYSDDFIRGITGASWEEYGRIFFPDADDEKLLAFHNRLEEMEAHFMKIHGRLFAGTEKMLRQLKEDGYSIAICSNSCLQYITSVLDLFGIRKDVDYIQPLLPGQNKKIILRILLDNVKPQKAVMIGDRYYDKEAAHANGLSFIGCMYGYNPDEVSDADIPIKDVSDVPAAVKKLIG